MQRLPQLKPTPVRTRHPLVYGAALLLIVALIAFIGRVGMFWVLSAAGLSSDGRRGDRHCPASALSVRLTSA